MFRVAFVIFIFILLMPRSASADADEVSLHMHFPVGYVTLQDPKAGDEVLRAPVFGWGGRLTYATSNWFAYEVHASWERLFHRMLLDLEPVGPEPVDPEDDYAGMWFSFGWLRLDAGITARMGVSWIPTLHASLGVQARVTRTWTQLGDWKHYNGWDLLYEPVMTLGLGLDHRLDEHWVIGWGASYRHVLPLESDMYQALSGMMHISYYWYPSPDD